MQTEIAAPPRSIPLSLRLIMLFGGFGNVFGWFFIGFGLIFVWAFGASQALHNLAFYSGELGVAEGIVTGVAETGVRVNKVPIHAYRYRYRVDEVDHTGVTEYFRGEFKPEDIVRIEYVLDDPARSRIAGLDDSHPELIIAVVFPVVGMVFVVIGVRHGSKGIRLLRTGRLALGTFVRKTGTRTRINGRPVYKFIFGFTAADGRSYTATATTHDTARLEPGIGEPGTLKPLFYNPRNPSDAVMLDDLPGDPSIGPSGEIQGSGAGLAVSLFVPAMTVVGHGAWALHVLEIL